MNPQQITDMVRRSRAEQGLPPTVDDPAVLDRIAALLQPWLDQQPTDQKRRGAA